MNAEDVLMYGNNTMKMTLAQISGSQWEQPDVCGWWSCRQILAHLTSFERFLVEVLDTYLGEEAGPTMKKMNDPQFDFNLHEVADRDEMSADEIMAEYDGYHGLVREKIAQIPVETRRQAGLIPWYGPEYDLEDIIAYMFYGHKREHMAQVNVFVDTLKK